MTEEPLHPLESLQLIDAMIKKAKNSFSENGHLYLLWGWVILLCSVGHFLMQNIFMVEKFYFIWLLTWVAFGYQFLYLRNKKRKKLVKTYTDHIIKYVWLCFFIMMVLLMLVVIWFAGNGRPTSAVFLVLYGMPTFLSGIILKFPALLRGGIICWLLSLLSLIIPVEYHMLLIAAAVIAAWIVPGYLLQTHYKKVNA